TVRLPMRACRFARRIHRHASVDACAVHDAHARGADITFEVAGLCDCYRSRGVEVALNMPFHRDHGTVYVPFHPRVAADRETLRVSDRALYVAVDHEVFLGVQLTFESQGGPQDRDLLALRVICARHLNFSGMDRRRSVASFTVNSPGRP